MNIIATISNVLSARLFAAVTITSLLLSAFLVAFFTANAAGTTIAGESHTFDVSNTSYNSTVDTTGLQNIVLTFDYDGSTLEPQTGNGSNEPVVVNYSAGSVSDSVVVSDANPTGSVTLSGLTADANLAISITAVDTSDFAGDDAIELTNITVSGDLLPVACADQVEPGLASGTVENTDTNQFFSTIQNAIDDCDTDDGDTIEVSAGTYNEAVIIDKSISLLGPNDSISAVTGTRAPEAVITEHLRTDVATDVEVSGFEFSGVQTGPFTIYVIGDSEGFTFNNNRFIDNANVAIKTPRTGVAKDITIAGNLINGVTASPQSGLFLGGVTGDSSITDNRIVDTAYGGIVISTVDSLLIANNEIENVPQQGIQLATDVSGVTIQNNTITNANTDQAVDKGAIRLYASDVTGPVLITNNTISGGHNGIAIKDGQDVTGKDIIIDDNDILSPDTGVQLYNGGTGELAAKNNWWGVDTGIMTSTGDVDTDPWLCGPFATEPEVSISGACSTEPNDEETVAEVTMCKVDQAGNELAGWQLALLGTEIDSLAVLPDGSLQSFTGVQAGEYVLKAEGTYEYRSNTGLLADARFSQRQAGDVGFGSYPYQPWTIISPTNGALAVQVNGDLGQLWGDVFSPSNVYYGALTQATTDPIEFNVYDNQYRDNVGAIDLTLFTGRTGVTEQDGCVTFTDVPYGDYQVEELQQFGWTNVSGLGSVTVDEETETFTVVNTDQEEVFSCVVSGTGTIIEETSEYAVGTYDSHSRWTASIPGAEWIWNTFFANSGVVNTFVETFTITGASSAVLEVAADNSYIVTINGVEVADVSDLDNFQTSTQDVYDVTSFLQPGENTLEIEVTNQTWNTRPQTNPAGVLYSLSVDADAKCELTTELLPEYGPYCGDGEINQAWEACEADDATGTCNLATCQYDNQCTEQNLVKIDLHESQSASFNDTLYLGSATNPIPGGVWFNFDEVGDASAGSVANDIEGLAVERDQTNQELYLALAGDNRSGEIDYAVGSIEFLGLEMTQADVNRTPNPQFKLENGSGASFEDVFDVTSSTTIGFDLRADTGDDGVTVGVTDVDVCQVAQECHLPYTVIFGDDSDDTTFSTTTATGLVIEETVDGYKIGLYDDGRAGIYRVAGTIVFPVGTDTTAFTLDELSGSDGLEQLSLSYPDVFNPVGNTIEFDLYVNGANDVVTVTADSLQSEANCTLEAPSSSLEITNPATDGMVLSGVTTFNALYHDFDNDDDEVFWAIRAGSCNGVDMAGNAPASPQPFNPSTFATSTGEFETTVDMSAWANGDYCLVVNPREDAGAPDERATRTFALDNPFVLPPSTVEGVITGVKWNDENGNGIQEPDEPLLPNWTIEITDGVTSTTTVTNADGEYRFEVAAGVWEVSEQPQPGWTQTGTEYLDDPSDDLTCTFGIGQESNPDVGLIQSTSPIVFAPEFRCDFGNQQNQTITPTSRSGGSSGTRIGARSSNAAPQGQVLGAADSLMQCEMFITEYMRSGEANNRHQVLNLQAFLMGYMGYDVDLTGEFDAATEAAVRDFQAEYVSDILVPWVELDYMSNSEPTGYAYKLTRWKINNMMCPGSEDYPTIVNG